MHTTKWWRPRWSRWIRRRLKSRLRRKHLSIPRKWLRRKGQPPMSIHLCWRKKRIWLWTPLRTNFMLPWLQCPMNILAGPPPESNPWEKAWWLTWEILRRFFSLMVKGPPLVSGTLWCRPTYAGMHGFFCRTCFPKCTCPRCNKPLIRKWMREWILGFYRYAKLIRFFLF